MIRYCNDYVTPEKHYCTTFIGSWDDEENFNNHIQAEVEMQGLKLTDKIISNKKRSYKQKINNIQNDMDKDIKIKELEEKLKQYENKYNKLQYKEPEKKEEVVTVKHFGKPKPKLYIVEEDDEPDWDDIDEEDIHNKRF